MDTLTQLPRMESLLLACWMDRKRGLINKRPWFISLTWAKEICSHFFSRINNLIFFQESTILINIFSLMWNFIIAYNEIPMHILLNFQFSFKIWVLIFQFLVLSTHTIHRFSYSYCNLWNTYFKWCSTLYRKKARLLVVDFQIEQTWNLKNSESQVWYKLANKIYSRFF